MRDVDTIAVDLGGVAARFVPERRLSGLVAATGLPAEQIDKRIFGEGLDGRLERGEVESADEAVALLLEALDHGVDAVSLVQIWSLAFEPNPDVLNILRARSETVVLFTNNGPIVEACLDEPLRAVKDACDAIVCSYQLRAVKPDPDAFNRFAALRGAAPSQLLLVDDSLANVDAARRAGWQASVVTNAVELARVLADPK